MTDGYKYRFLFLDFELPYFIKDSDTPVGGACVRVNTFSKGLINLGHKVGILTWKGACNFVDEKQEVDLIETYDPKRGIPKIRWIFYRIPVLFIRILNYKADYLFIKSAGGMLGIIALIAFFTRTKLVFMVTNDIDADDRVDYRLNTVNKVLYKLGLFASSSIFCQNDYQYNIFQRKYAKKNVFKVTNPFLPSKEIDKPKRDIDRNYVAWLGIFQPQKDIPSLYIIAKTNPNTMFHIGGKDNGNLNTEDADAIKKLRELTNVKFVGYLKRSEILYFLSNAKVLLNTSHYEGFSNTFLESFYVGTPVVSLRVDPDGIINKFGLGSVIDFKQFGVALKSIEDKNKENLLSKNIQNYVRNNHNHNKLADCLIRQLAKTQ
jgi:hypothetical protein